MKKIPKGVIIKKEPKEDIHKDSGDEEEEEYKVIRRSRRIKRQVVVLDDDEDSEEQFNTQKKARQHAQCLDDEQQPCRSRRGRKK